MISFKHNCPYCGVVNGFFEVANFYRREYEDIPIDIYAILGVCNSCGKGIVANCGVKNKSRIIPSQSILGKRICSLSDEVLKILGNQNGKKYDLFELLGFEPDFFPKNPEPEIPEHLPNDVLQKIRAAEILYLQARGNADLLEFAGTAYRKALEFALAYLDENSGDKSLYHRIKLLETTGVLVKSMGAFAHRIRALGNEATHDDITVEELTDLRLFTQLFLQYTFTLPAKIPE